MERASEEGEGSCGGGEQPLMQPSLKSSKKDTRKGPAAAAGRTQSNEERAINLFRAAAGLVCLSVVYPA